MWEKAVRRRGTCKNPVRLSTYDGPTETGPVEHMWVNILYMLNWIIRLGHKTAERRFLGISAQLVSAQNETLLWLAGIN